MIRLIRFQNIRGFSEDVLGSGDDPDEAAHPVRISDNVEAKDIICFFICAPL